ncbi:xanthine dehydrogenase family protein molybdopterin-binding subunit [Chelativorans sp. M5D2P16]|uniref:xanthine dehydrogenase family protein molybdopterin-binding subunit n=1 Tax=Chelativorans sp. M5D2P16 TaxID=3095678 RepID=UPI002ACAE11E|nr:molybdopterin cofactor-binding domain-containing protein [Chelativorans sp. M5D2P16]MDZ5698521.1 molybdopterin cofactor-binding domain-containing protein [Chelativorans sp. M5D2P16]
MKFTAAGIAVTIAPLKSARAALLEKKIQMAPGASQTGRLKRRMDGLAKVTGGKVFARDIRARDMPDWPDDQAHAFMVFADRADASFIGLDFSVLGEDLQPDVIVTAEETTKAGLDFYDPFTFGERMLLPKGEVPLFLGHPLAILIYNDFARFAVAKRTYQANRDRIVRFGETTGPATRDPYANFRFVRIEGAEGAEGETDVFNPVDDGYVFASYKDHQVRWPDPDAGGDVNARGMFHADAIRSELDSPPSDWHVVEREYYSPYIDAAALEPDNCNCWFDEEAARLEIVMASQSPHEVMTGTAAMLEKSTFKVQELKGHPAYTVGYGTKEHSPFPYYGVVAALHAQGRPVRLALDREEHFQTAIKRHPVRMRYRLAVDRRSLRLQSFVGDLELDGGGRQNYTTPVTQVAAGAAQGIYYLPKNDIVAIGRSSRAPHAGSVRGFGSLEAQIGMEMLVDEIAEELGVDPMELRHVNALENGQRNSAGAVPLGKSRMKEMIEADRQHPVWVGRETRKADFEAANPALRYGVGYAIGKKGFGNSNEGVAAAISLTRDGKVRLRHIAVEIGTGAVSTQALICARWFGRPADETESAALDWSPLEMFVTMSPFAMDKAHQDEMKQDPRWTPAFASASSATNSVFYFSHGTQEAGRLIFERGILPAAAALWGSSIDRAAAARWNDGVFTLSDGRPLTLAEIAAKAHDMGAVTGAMVHAFDRWGWSEADFDILGETSRRPLDGLAIQTGSDRWRRIERRNVHYMDPQLDNASWSRFAPVSALVELTVNRGTGAVKLLSHHSSLDCGRILVPEFVSGQLQGGIGMAVGHALYEGMPLYEGGPGQGHWNYNRYRLPRGKDVAVWSQTANYLPVSQEEDFPKGIAEVVQIPTIPAIANAVAHAIGRRMRDLPLTEDKIKEVLI